MSETQPTLKDVRKAQNDFMQLLKQYDATHPPTRQQKKRNEKIKAYIRLKKDCKETAFQIALILFERLEHSDRKAAQMFDKFFLLISLYPAIDESNYEHFVRTNREATRLLATLKKSDQPKSKKRKTSPARKLRTKRGA